MNNAIFLQYGAIGAITVAALIAVRVMYGQFQKTFDAERERANRLEVELRELNEVIRTEYVRTITDATRAISDAMAAVRRG